MVRIASKDPEQARNDENMRVLLDAYEQAVLDRQTAQSEADKAEAGNRWLMLRKRLFNLGTVMNADHISMTHDAMLAMLEVARKDEIDRAACWMHVHADRALAHGGSAQWEEAQLLFRYAALIRDMTPFPYMPPHEGGELSASFPTH